MPVCGYRAGSFGLGLAQLSAQIRFEIEDFRPDPGSGYPWDPAKFGPRGYQCWRSMDVATVRALVQKPFSSGQGP